MKKAIIAILALALLAGAGLWLYRTIITSEFKGTPVAVPVVDYSCDADRHIAARYHAGTTTPVAEEGVPPVPTGYVVVSFDHGEPVTLLQTLSASGVRYANEDESLVFWNKGNEVFVMRDGEVNSAYANCVSE